MTPSLLSKTARAAALVVTLGGSLAGCSGDGDPKSGDSGAIGVGRAAAGCEPIRTKPYKVPAVGSNHVPIGTEIDYDSPPAAAIHYDTFPDLVRSMYSVEDRPILQDLVHMLEHGYNVLWYDESIGDDDEAMDDLHAIADKYPVGDYVVIAPWTEKDGDPFPGDAHVALTHWRFSPDESGVWEYCQKVSGEVFDEFHDEYPKSNSPEPNAP